MEFAVLLACLASSVPAFSSSSKESIRMFGCYTNGAVIPRGQCDGQIVTSHQQTLKTRGNSMAEEETEDKEPTLTTDCRIGFKGATFIES